MNQPVPRSSYSLLALSIGMVLSVATTCGPGDPLPPGYWDTGGGWDTGYWDTGYTDWDVGVTEADATEIRLDAVGDSVVQTVRVNLAEDCLTEGGDGSWTSPTGWTVIGVGLTALAAPEDTAAADTADTSGDTADTGGDSGGSSSGAAARFHVSVTRSDGVVVLDDGFALYDDLLTRALASDLEAFPSCLEGVACEVTWRVEITLTEGAAVEGDLNVHSRIQMCSAREGGASDIAVAIE